MFPPRTPFFLLKTTRTALGLPPGKALLRPRTVRVVSIVAIKLELVRERRPLLRQGRSLRTVQRDLEHAEPEDRALQPHRSQRDADLVEQLLLGQRRDLGRLPP